MSTFDIRKKRLDTLANTLGASYLGHYPGGARQVFIVTRAPLRGFAARGIGLRRPPRSISRLAEKNPPVLGYYVSMNHNCGGQKSVEPP